jgi:hypothetical protein
MDFNQAVSDEPGNLQADGVRSDVNGGEGWHSATVYNSGEGVPVKRLKAECARLRFAP